MKKNVALLALVLVLSLAVQCVAPPATAPQPAAPAAAPAAAAPTEAPQAPAKEAAPKAEAKPEGALTIGYSAPDLGGAQIQIQQGILDHAKAKGWTVLTANADFDAQKQADQIDYFIAQGVDALVVGPVDSHGICASVQKAKDANIPFYTVDRPPLGCEVNMTIASDNVMAGVQAAEETVDRLTARYGSAKGTVLNIQGDMAISAFVDREAGFMKVMKQHPDVKIIAKPGMLDFQKWAQIARDVAGNEEIDAIYSPTECAGFPVIIPALEQIGKKLPYADAKHIILTGVDGCPASHAAIRAGFADEVSSQPIPDFGIIMDWIQKDKNHETYQAGQVVQEGAYWSPATLTKGDTGWQLLLATIKVTPKNVDDPALWGNKGG